MAGDASPDPTAARRTLLEDVIYGPAHVGTAYTVPLFEAFMTRMMPAP